MNVKSVSETGTEVVADVAFVLAACGHERFDGLEEFFDVLGPDGYPA